MTNSRARLARIALGAALALLRLTSAHAQDCKLVEMASLPTGTDRAGEITVPVTINGKPEQMAVKMGSWIGAVTQKLADTLELRVHSMDEASIRNPTLRLNPIYMENGERAKHVTQIALLTIGAERVTDTDFIVYPSPPDDDGSIAGLIGHDILGSFDLDFDFAGNKLNLFSQDHCEGKVVYWATAYTDAPMRTTGGDAEVAMTLDGHDINASIDTGATTTSMTFAEASAAFGISQQSPGIIVTTEGTGAQQHSRYQYRFKRLALSGIAVNNPLIDLVPDAIGKASQRDLDDQKLQGYQGKEAIHTPNLMVGLDVLRHLHLYIAYKEGKIYATGADAAPPATPASASPPAPAGH